MDFNQSPTPEMFVLSTMSAVGSLSVVFSILYFRKNLFEKPSMRVLLYVFISNLLTSWGSLVGYPEDQSFACWFQGIVTNIFTLSSILWSVVITGMLYIMLVAKYQFEITIWTHIVCWGVPIFATVIPFINSTYGSPDSAGWCWIVDTSFSPDWAPLVWYWVSYYLWVWAAFVAIVALFVMMRIKYATELPLEIQNRFKTAMRGLHGYPLIILFCWLPSTISDFLAYYGTYTTVEPGDPVDTFICCCACSMGLLSSIYFWRTNDSVVDLWDEKISEVVGSSIGRRLSTSLKPLESGEDGSGFESMNFGRVFFQRMVKRHVGASESKSGATVAGREERGVIRKVVLPRLTIPLGKKVAVEELAAAIISDRDDLDQEPGIDNFTIKKKPAPTTAVADTRTTPKTTDEVVAFDLPMLHYDDDTPGNFSESGKSMNMNSNFNFNCNHNGEDKLAFTGSNNQYGPSAAYFSVAPPSSCQLTGDGRQEVGEEEENRDDGTSISICDVTNLPV